jgi:P22_AR N-terminal domain
MKSLIEVPFNGETVLLFDADGEPFVPIKPLSERFGIDWKSQHRKLATAKTRYGMVILMIPSAGGDQETTCIPLRKLPSWIYSIHPNKVAEALRPTLIRYQEECDDVLWQHWSGTHTKEAALLRRQNQSLKAYCLAFNPLWGKIAALQKAGVWCQFMRHHVKKSALEVGEIIRAMELAGVIDEEDWVDAEFITRSSEQAELFSAEPAAEVQA